MSRYLVVDYRDGREVGIDADGSFHPLDQTEMNDRLAAEAIALKHGGRVIHEDRLFSSDDYDQE